MSYPNVQEIVRIEWKKINCINCSCLYVDFCPINGVVLAPVE